jgi:hypothetical protein
MIFQDSDPTFSLEQHIDDATCAKPLRKEWRDGDGKLQSRRRLARVLAEMQQLQAQYNAQNQPTLSEEEKRLLKYLRTESLQAKPVMIRPSDRMYICK